MSNQPPDSLPAPDLVPHYTSEVSPGVVCERRKLNPGFPAGGRYEINGHGDQVITYDVPGGRTVSTRTDSKVKMYPPSED